MPVQTHVQTCLKYSQLEILSDFIENTVKEKWSEHTQCSELCSSWVCETALKGDRSDDFFKIKTNAGVWGNIQNLKKIKKWNISSVRLAVTATPKIDNQFVFQVNSPRT